VRQAIAEALSSIGHRGTLPKAQREAQQKEQTEIDSLIRALGHSKFYLHIAREALIPYGQRALPALIEALNHPSELIRDNARSVLQAIAPTMAWLDDSDNLVGGQARESLITGGQSAVPASEAPSGQPKQSMRKLSWELLPPGKAPFAKIKSHFQRLAASGNSKHQQYKPERIDTIKRLGPDETYIGSREFEGYAVFYFRAKQVAVLDCPFVGNAIYVIRGDWQRLSHLSKAELLAFHPKQVRRIIHRGRWVARLATTLGSRW